LPVASAEQFLGCQLLQWYCFWDAYHFSGTVFGLPVASNEQFSGCQLLQMSVMAEAWLVRIRRTWSNF